VANTFAYHFTPAGSMLESGAAALGCTVVRPASADRNAGGGDSRPRHRRFLGTPSFLKLIVEKATR